MLADAFSKVLAVVGTGAVELWAAIPLGLALGLNPVVVGAASALGAILSAAAVILIGGPVRRWAVRRLGPGSRRGRRARRVWERYGLIGLGLASPLLTGAPLGAALGVALGAPAGRLLAWMSIGIAVWSGLLTAASALGWAGLGHLF